MHRRNHLVLHQLVSDAIINISFYIRIVQVKNFVKSDETKSGIVVWFQGITSRSNKVIPSLIICVS